MFFIFTIFIILSMFIINGYIQERHSHSSHTPTTLEGYLHEFESSMRVSFVSE